MDNHDPKKAAMEWRQHWPVPFISMLGLSVGAIYIYTLGIFMEPLQSELGWSRTEISLGLTLVSVVTVCFAPLLGMIIDRFGARRLAIPGMMVFCSSIALLSKVGSEIWMWWAGWLLVALGSASIKPTVWAAAVSSYFSAGRGLAIAVALCGTGLGQTLLPPITNALIENFGWRIAYASLGIGSALIILPLMFFFFYDAREKERLKGTTNTKNITLPGLGVREGYLSRRFLFLALTALLATFSIVGLVVHFVPMLTAGGLDRTSAATVAGIIGLASMTGRVGSGYLLDRINGRIIGAIAYGIPGIACILLLMYDGSTFYAFGLALLIGLSLGAEIDILAYLASRYFGLRNYGVLFGTIVAMTTVGGGSGPVLMGAIYDMTGGYTSALMILIPLFPITSALVASLGPYPVFNDPEPSNTEATA